MYDNRLVPIVREAIEMGVHCAEATSKELETAHAMFSTLCVDLYQRGILTSPYHCLRDRIRTVPFARVSNTRIEFDVHANGDACIAITAMPTLNYVPESDEAGQSPHRTWLGWIRLLLMLLAASIMWIRREDDSKHADRIYGQCILIDHY